MSDQSGLGNEFAFQAGTISMSSDTGLSRLNAVGQAAADVLQSFVSVAQVGNQAWVADEITNTDWVALTADSNIISSWRGLAMELESAQSGAEKLAVIGVLESDTELAENIDNALAVVREHYSMAEQLHRHFNPERTTEGPVPVAEPAPDLSR